MSSLAPIRDLKVALLRPYIRRELPGWWPLYRLAFGGAARGKSWRGEAPVWMRSKMTGFESRLDLTNWSNRLSYFLGRYYDLPTQLLVLTVLHAGDTFVDIGANEGAITLAAASMVGPQGRIVAFEPNSVPRDVLKANIGRNALSIVDVRSVGLSDRPGILPLFVPDANSGEGSFGARPGQGAAGRLVDCEIQRTDDALKGVTPVLIKIDVEGFETNVLNGMTDLVEHAKPAITIEMNGHHLARASSSVAEVVHFFKTRNYEPFGLGSRGAGKEAKLWLHRPTFSEDIATDVVWVPEGSAMAKRLTGFLDPKSRVVVR